MARNNKHNISKDNIGPAIVGFVTQNAGNNLRAGMLAGCVFPIVLIISVCLLKANKR